MTHDQAKAALVPAVHAIIARKGRAAVAIDGMAASGKTTLCAALAGDLPGCAVVHMDDFTLPFDKRFPGYFDALLSNADLDRFDREVLSPFLRGGEAVYRPFICHPEPGFGAPIRVPADTRVLLVEGAYCLHPQLSDRFDLRVLSLIAPQLQRERVLRRNGEAQLARYLSMWIPMENRHIQAHDLHARCDVVLTAE